MRIVICGSINFAEKMREIEQGLRELGHEVVVPCTLSKDNINSYGDAQKLRENKEYHMAIKPERTRMHMDEIKKGDAILVVNQEKNGIPNYLGGATFAEMVFAFYMGKRIFMLNPVPTDEKLRMLRDEIEAVKPVIINGNLEEIA